MNELMSLSYIPNEESITKVDEWLAPYKPKIMRRIHHTQQFAERILQGASVEDFALGYLHFGLHQTEDGWVYRDWAPGATKMYLIGEFSKWKDDENFRLKRLANGEWELHLPHTALKHLDHYKLHVYWLNGDGERVPAWARYVVQDDETKLFDAVVWQPKKSYKWHDTAFKPHSFLPIIYEAHVGMASADEKVASYREFADDIIPRIVKGGYNTVQLMAVAEHPYYGSFGYHVSSFFAPSSRFGTPDDFKYLVDTAHAAGLKVIVDIVHSHAVKNEKEGLSRYDGSLRQYFHDGDRGNHSQWDSRVFDYGKPQVAHFLLSNCRYWIDEFHVDGYRFDGVTSMLYTDHGLNKDFVSYDAYFENGDLDAQAYLTLANLLIHTIKPEALTIAEDMSGMPGLAAPIADGGIGFDYRLSMGMPDLWIKYIKERRDEDWDIAQLYHELTQHRPEEKTISYAESHDQALVGDKTLMFRLADKDMYDHMSVSDDNLVVDRAVALHKMIRLLTASLNSGGYLTFMGNEFGHPEWIDFPREGNKWSYQYARRQWHLADDKKLKYHYLALFDHVLMLMLPALTGPPNQLHVHNDDNIVAYSRGNVLFVFNFHPNKSFTDYEIPVDNGTYSVLLSTDNSRYGGSDRVDTKMEYTSKKGKLRLYIPSRTALVLRRMVK